MPGALELLALMLHCEARRTAMGGDVPSSEQDVTGWSWPTIEEAERCFTPAAKAGPIGHAQVPGAPARE